MSNFSPPSMPPPPFTPVYCPILEPLSKNFMENQINRYVYIWLDNKMSFWFYCIDIKNHIVFGYAWVDEKLVYVYFDIGRINNIY